MLFSYEGPTFSVFSEWFFDVICSGDLVSAIKTVSIANVLINAALSNLLSLIQKLDEAIYQMLENQVFIELISQSQYKF